MEKNKIALVTYSLSTGGLERVVANSTFMFESMGYEVHLYVIASKVNYAFTGKLHLFKVDKLSKLGKVKAYFKIKNAIKKQNFDIVIDHRYRLNAVTELFWQKCIYNNLKVINYIHNYHIYSYLFKSSFFNKILFSDTKLVCVSKGIQDELLRVFPFLDTITIYNPVRLEEYSITMTNDFVLTIARMDKSNVKQIDVLLDCYSKSELPKNNIRLIILGEGERLNEMKLYSEKLKVSHLVDFKGFVSNPQGYLQNALFTTLTSKNEGLPTVLIESLQVGTPVVSFDCPTGPSEIISNGINGLLVENQNQQKLIEAFNKMVLDHNSYRFMRSNAKKSVEHFSIEVVKKEWQQLINYIH